jgi:hypothetical protein
MRITDAPATACRSCGAPVRWVNLNGRPHPVDAAPHPAGNLAEVPGAPVPSVTVVGRGAGAWQSHFATCPDAHTWRKRRQA